MKKLQARRRVGLGKGAGRRIRARGMIPAVLYGNQQGPESLAVNPGDVKALLQSSRGQNAIFSVEVDGGETVELARVKAFQKDPIKRTLVHCDLQRLSADKPELFKVPIVLTGESPAVKIGCKMRFITKTIPVSCLPGDCPETLEVSIDSLEAGDIIRLGEVDCPSSMTFEMADNIPVVSVSANVIVYEDELEEGEGEEGAEAADGAAAEGGDDSATASGDDKADG
jgi:large subunit ribosomal protein L25